MGLPQRKPPASSGIIHPKKAPAAGAGTRQAPKVAPAKGQVKKPQNAPKVVVLNKGDILFKEGERSRGMYILQEGSLRLYKKKGQGFIELAVIHSGEVIGELAFFDGEPRSASAEALSQCKLIMVSFEQMEKQLGMLPNWLTSLIQSVVKRLRAASTKVKQLESSSVSYYGSGGNATYLYLMLPDVLKFMASMVLVASRHGKEGKNGHVTIGPSILEMVASKMLGAPISKLMDFLDVLQDEKFIKLQKSDDENDGEDFRVDIHNLKQFEKMNLKGSD
jgi:CRP-like cAMP-binding protein